MATLRRLDRRLLRQPEFRLAAAFVPGRLRAVILALLFGSFLAVRKERWLIPPARALATVVRPLGIFALIGIGVALFWRRSYCTLLLAILIGSVVGALYATLGWHFGDPLATVNSYHSREWQVAGFLDSPCHQGHADRTRTAD